MQHTSAISLRSSSHAGVQMETDEIKKSGKMADACLTALLLLLHFFEKSVTRNDALNHTIFGIIHFV